MTKKAYCSVRNEALYSILTEFCIHMTLVRQAKYVQMKPTVKFVESNVYRVLIQKGLKQVHGI